MTSRYWAGDSSATPFPPTPALFTRTSTAGTVEDLVEAAPDRCVVGDVELHEPHLDAPLGRHGDELVARSLLRTVPYTSWPRAARWIAVARPMPEFAPVTTATGGTEVMPRR